MPTQASERISWKQLSPIFADVVLSPWNLLVGGLLIQYLPPLEALASIVSGYTVLALVFILYGGLGYKKRVQSAVIFQEIFQGSFGNIFIPLLLACGQLGWAAINIGLGGSSLAQLVHVPRAVGLIAYALAIGFLASVKLYRLAYVKGIIIASSVSLAIYIGILKIHATGFGQFLAYHPAHHKSLFWGCSVVVASLISFATVSPDLFQNARHKRDVTRSTIWGVVLPGIVLCALGCFFFFNRQLNLISLIGSLSVPALANIFNSVANADGSIAVYTPALKFGIIFKSPILLGIAGGTLISLVLALLKITNYLEVWLKALSIISPVLIGVAFAAVLFDKKAFRHLPASFSKYAYGLTVVICGSLLSQAVPVIFALIAPLLIYSIYLQYRHIHE